MKKSKVILSTLLCLLPIFLGVALYDQLPEQVPTHFDLAGNANGWSSRPMAVFGIPMVMAGLNLLCHWLSSRDARVQKATPKALAETTFWIIPVVSLMVVPMCLFEAVGVDVPITAMSSVLIGVVFVVIGNYLPKCKPNPYMGIKLPWTFASEENWRKTHRFGGKVWVVCGFLAIFAGLTQNNVLFGVVLLISIVLPCGYSYREYKKEKTEE